jgi:hypothetical protein
VHAHRRFGAAVGHPVHVVPAEVAHPASGEPGGTLAGTHGLGQRAADDGEGAGGTAVVVQVGALAGQPGQQPDLGAGQVLVRGRVEDVGGGRVGER